MKTIIIYMTRHGCTKKAAHLLKEKLEGEIILCDLSEIRAPGLYDSDTIIIGGSIHASQIQKKIKAFCASRIPTLLKKRLGLYLCCMKEGKEAQDQFDNAFPESPLQHALATGLFGGEFNFEKMNFVEKFMVRKMAHSKKSVSKFDEQSADTFSGVISEVLALCRVGE